MHYKVLYEESKELPNGSLVYRIESTEDNIHAAEGAKGGWIADPMNLSGSAWVDGEAMVFGKATVTGKALVCDNAEVSGNCIIEDNAKISGNAEVTGKATISGDAVVTGNCIVKENAQVRYKAVLLSDCNVKGKSLVQDGVWTKTPFTAPFGKNNYHFSESIPGFIRVGCEMKTYEGWLYDGWYYARKKNGEAWTTKFFDLYYKAIPADILEPIVKKFLEDPKKETSDSYLKVILNKHSSFLKEQGIEDYTNQYKV